MCCCEDPFCPQTSERAPFRGGGAKGKKFFGLGLHLHLLAPPPPPPLKTKPPPLQIPLLPLSLYVSQHFLPQASVSNHGCVLQTALRRRRPSARAIAPAPPPPQAASCSRRARNSEQKHFGGQGLGRARATTGVALRCDRCARPSYCAARISRATTRGPAIERQRGTTLTLLLLPPLPQKTQKTTRRQGSRLARPCRQGARPDPQGAAAGEEEEAHGPRVQAHEVQPPLRQRR